MTQAKKEFYLNFIINKLIGYGNGEWDTEGFKKSEYGFAMADRVSRWLRFDPDSTSEDCINYYRELGVKRELHDDGTYYGRWSILYPLELVLGRKYPLIIMHHGVTDSLENAEFNSGYGDICGKEGFIALFIQNSNVDNTLRILDNVMENYPVDPERVFISGHSQGGRQASSFTIEHPERVTAFALSGNDVFRNGDVFGRMYTAEEFDRLKEVFVPCMQIAGQFEYGNILPLNIWRDPPANRWREPEALEARDWVAGLARDPRRDAEQDPTRPPGAKRYNPCPPENATQDEKDNWKITMLNKRLDTLNIEPRDVEKCLYWRDNPDTELHKVLGFYGDFERITYYYGYKHFMVDIKNRAGVDAFRYVGVENMPHCISLMHGHLTWEFFKQFRRDTATGRIIADEYRVY